MNINSQQKSAVLVGIDFYGKSGVSKYEAELSLEELCRLAETAALKVEAKLIQRKTKPENSTYIGKGKVEELAKFCILKEIDIVIFDDELSGTQLKNLEAMLNTAVIDRTTLILDIFAMRAKSSEGRIQVELAQLQYRLPRLAGMGNSLSRLGGGIGTRGPGETKLETDRRHINRRINYLKNAIEESAKNRVQSRKKRNKDGIPTAAFMGYTNAGKSSLMNKLCGSDIYTEDLLFATLDTTTKKLKTGGNIEALLIDTVGFIRKLPTELVDAFKSTLEESLEADLLLHVIDSSDSDAEAQIKVTEDLLGELGADKKERFIIFNKCDLNPQINIAGSRYLPQELSLFARAKGHRVFFTSVVSGEGIDELRDACIDFFEEKKKKQNQVKDI